jgi:hypothetical protein
MRFRIIEDPMRPKPIVYDLREILDAVGTDLEKLESISSERQHAVESQLLAIIRRLGYRPTIEAGKPLTAHAIHEQLIRCCDAIKNEVPDHKFEMVIRYALAVQSNVAAEIKLEAAPDKEKEVPPANKP